MIRERDLSLRAPEAALGSCCKMIVVGTACVSELAIDRSLCAEIQRTDKVDGIMKSHKIGDMLN